MKVGKLIQIAGQGGAAGKWRKIEPFATPNRYLKDLGDVEPVK
jgi:hypothetical protein